MSPPVELPAQPPHTGRRPVSRAPVVVLVVGLSLAFALVLLGGQLANRPAPPPDLSSPGTPEQPRSVNVLLHDYRFSPRTLHLVGGETVRFEVINAGLVEHEMVLGDDPVQRAWADAHAQATPPGPFASPPPASVRPDVGGLRVLLGPGQSTSVSYQVPTDQALQLMCHLPGHLERGMVGGVQVEPR